MTRKPIELDDAGGPGHRGRQPAGDVAAVWGFAKWATLAVGLVFALVAVFKATIVEAAPLAGLACFLGIVARIFQAEEHRPR